MDNPTNGMMPRCHSVLETNVGTTVESLIAVSEGSMRESMPTFFAKNLSLKKILLKMLVKDCEYFQLIFILFFYLRY